MDKSNWNLTGLVIILIFLAACNKSGNSTHHINCGNLITDSSWVNDNAKIFIASAFTPNADGLNDHCIPITTNISAIDFIIYDEDNSVRFETTQIGQGWPSAPTPISYKKYYYNIQATTTKNHKIGLCGEVYALKCTPRGMKMSDFRFQDQISEFGFTKSTNDNVDYCY